MIRPRPSGDHHAVDDGGAVHVLGPRRPNVGLERGISRRPAPLEHTGRSERKRRVAELRDRLLLGEKVLDDVPEVGVVTDVLGGPPSWDHEGDVLRRIDLREGEVCVPGIARLLGVGVIALDEVVDDELKLLLAWGRDLDLVALLD